jgi:hypothetical protein
MSTVNGFLSSVKLRLHSPLMLSLITLCVVIGGIGLMVPDHPAMLWVTSSTLTILGVIGLVRLMGVADFATPWSVLCVSYALAYGLGTFNSFMSGYSSGMDLLALTYAPPDVVVQVMSGLLMLSGLLLLLGELDSNKMVPVSELSALDMRMVQTVLFGTLVLSIVAVASGQLGFQTDMRADEDSNRVSVLSNLISSAMPAMVATGFYCARTMNGRQRLWTFILAGAIMLILMTQGRRIVIYTAVMAVIGYFSAQGLTSIFKPKGLLTLLVIGVLVASAAKMFFAMRQATYDLPKGFNMVELAEAGFKKMSGDAQGDLEEKLKENQQTRTFILGYAAEIMYGLERHEPVGGGLMELGVATAVPTVIWPGKWKIMAAGGSEENICNPQLGLPAYDAANSLLTSGSCDFGWYGFYAYPLLFALIFSVTVFLLRRLPVVPRLVYGFSLIFSLLNAESVISGYFVMIRNGVILAIILTVFQGFLSWTAKQPKR